MSPKKSETLCPFDVVLRKHMYDNALRVSGVFTVHQNRPSDNRKLPGILSPVSLSCCDGWKVLHTL